MNALSKDLTKLVKMIEKIESRTGEPDRFRTRFHLAPPAGWLNDPNGLCQYQGLYHAFFQYSPFDVEGGLKLWGHSTSRDMLHWEYQGAALYPDQPFDCHGVYSGCALIEDGRISFYYTGNVKLDGDFDYVTEGREANTILVESGDGFRFGRKQLLMTNEDYPEDVTKHVRDPKVWKENGIYYMIQGARRKDDVGEALLFASSDRIHWLLKNRITTKEPFGFMWECPDYFEIDGKKILSASVQGLEGEKWKDKNVYQSGYFEVKGHVAEQCTLSEYVLWDYGFDYYAPQSFETEDGRRVQIGWMGMPDCPEHTNRTIEDGWQHCFTIPREIYVKDGRVLQRPVRELEERKRILAEATGGLYVEEESVYEARIAEIKENQFHAVLGEELILEYRDSRFEMRFINPSKDNASGGRTIRYQEIETLNNVTILTDVSTCEVFVNDGEYVFSTRFYPENYGLQIQADEAKIKMWELVS